MLLGGEGIEDHGALRLPHTLDDDLAGGLSGDTAEVLGLDLNAQHVAQSHPGQSPAGVGDGNLSVGVGHFLHHFFFDKHAHRALLFVGVHDHVVGDPGVVPLVGGHQSLGDLVDHVTFGNALFLLNVGDGGKEFLGVQLHALCSSLFLGHINELL